MRRLRFALCTSLWFALAGCSGGSTPTPASVPAAACARGRAFIVVRHAEKASQDRDPSLSERGHARANVLSSMFEKSGVTRLFATQYKRTQETLAPLAERLHVPIEVRPADKTNELLSELRKAPDGAVIVIASHSNVVPTIVRELSGQEMSGVTGGMLAEDDYSRVVVLTESCGPARPFVLELQSEAP